MKEQEKKYKLKYTEWKNCEEEGVLFWEKGPLMQVWYDGENTGFYFQEQEGAEEASGKKPGFRVEDAKKECDEYLQALIESWFEGVE